MKSFFCGAIVLLLSVFGLSISKASASEVPDFWNGIWGVHWTFKIDGQWSKWFLDDFHHPWFQISRVESRKDRSYIFYSKDEGDYTSKYALKINFGDISNIKEDCTISGTIEYWAETKNYGYDVESARETFAKAFTGGYGKIHDPAREKAYYLKKVVSQCRIYIIDVKRGEPILFSVFFEDVGIEISLKDVHWGN